ncbi:MAG TPA: SMP-30/gluconolactonase/LRE family protein [Streptosporangiaceae bacterium]
MRTKCLIVAITSLAAGSLWVGISQAAPRSVGAGVASAEVAGSSASHVVAAQLFAKVAGPDPGPFGTSLEGAAFNSHGDFYFVNTTAPRGRPKLMSLDLTTRKVSHLYTDAHSMLNCIGFAPDGAMDLCDIKGQRVVRFNPVTKRLVNVLTSVGKSSFVPDDLTIDRSGNMYIADYQGTPTSPTGRILLLPADGKADKAQVVLAGLAHPNGIVLAHGQTSLWIDEDLSGTLDHVAEQFSSPAAKAPTVTLHTAAYLNLGANAYTDSLTTDGRGNVYMAVYGAGEVIEFNPDGIQIGRVVFPRSAPRVTHVAIEPGTRRAFVTASGPGGGYIYTFPALAAAPAGVPNGG